MTYARPLFVTARFMNAQTGEIKEQTVFMGDFPMMTERGTFIINGTERIVVSQLVRSPGVYFGINPDKTSPEKDIVDAKMIPGRGAWLEFEVDKKDVVYVRIDRKRKQPVTVLLKALGLRRDRRGTAEPDPRPAGQPLRLDAQHAREGPHRGRRRRVHRHLPEAASGRAAHARLRRARCSRTSSSTRSATTWPRSAATRCRRSCATSTASCRSSASTSPSRTPTPRPARSTTSSRRPTSSPRCRTS